MSGKHSPLELIEVRERWESPRAPARRTRLGRCAHAVSESLRRLRERGETVLLDLDELEFIDVSGLVS